MENLKRAKELFEKWSGNFFVMMREGDWEEYNSYDVSRKQEIIWLEEYQKKVLKRLKDSSVCTYDFSIMFSTINQFLIKTIVSEFILILESNISKYDTFSKLIIAERSLELARKRKELYKDFKKLSLKFFKSVIEDDFRIDESYFKDGTLLPEILEKESIMKRANSGMKRAKSGMKKERREVRKAKRGIEKMKKRIEKRKKN